VKDTVFSHCGTLTPFQGSLELKRFLLLVVVRAWRNHVVIVAPIASLETMHAGTVHASSREESFNGYIDFLLDEVEAVVLRVVRVGLHSGCENTVC
jgi:hypothetical protein